MNAQDPRGLVLDALASIAPEADLDALPGDVELREELDIDSMDFLAFLTELTATTGKDIPEDDYEHLQTLDGAAEYIGRRLGEAPAQP